MKTEEPIKVQLKAYTTKELALIYDVSEKIMRGWITLFEDQLGKKKGRYYTPRQSRIIFDKLGIPEVIILH